MINLAMHDAGRGNKARLLERTGYVWGPASNMEMNDFLRL